MLIKGLSAVYSELEVSERLAHGETGSLVCRQLTGEVFFVLIIFLCTVNRWMYAYYYSSVVSIYRWLKDLYVDARCLI